MTARLHLFDTTLRDGAETHAPEQEKAAWKADWYVGVAGRQ